jgi:hypothetical protein
MRRESAAESLSLQPSWCDSRHFGQKDVAAAGIEVVPTDPPVTWQLRMSRPGGGNLQVDPVSHVMEVEDVLLVLGYEWE